MDQDVVWFEHTPSTACWTALSTASKSPLSTLSHMTHISRSYDWSRDPPAVCTAVRAEGVRGPLWRACAAPQTPRGSQTAGGVSDRAGQPASRGTAQRKRGYTMAQNIKRNGSFERLNFPKSTIFCKQTLWKCSRAACTSALSCTPVRLTNHTLKLEL